MLVVGGPASASKCSSARARSSEPRDRFVDIESPDVPRARAAAVHRLPRDESERSDLPLRALRAALEEVEVVVAVREPELGFRVADARGLFVGEHRKNGYSAEVLRGGGHAPMISAFDEALDCRARWHAPLGPSST